MEKVKTPAVEIGVAGVARPGEAESGDQHVARRFRNGALLAVVDGLGHGAEAAQAARMAVAALAEKPREPVDVLVRRCHERLRDTRGAVMSLASLDTSEGTLSWVCVGNIESMLVRSVAAAATSFVSLVQRAGVVGSQLPPLQATVTPIAAGDTLVMATDGIRAGFALQLPLSSRPQQIADHILSHHHSDKDDALVLVARYWGT